MRIMCASERRETCLPVGPVNPNFSREILQRAPGNRETHTILYYHVVFSTQLRRPTIKNEWIDRLHAFLGGIVRGQGGSAIVGGVEDHVHLLIGLKPSHRLSDIMREVKHESSRWVHETMLEPGFAWQKGYSAFTVSPLACEKVKQYIANQREHHTARK
jgi:putative transposase